MGTGRGFGRPRVDSTLGQIGCLQESPPTIGKISLRNAVADKHQRELMPFAASKSFVLGPVPRISQSPYAGRALTSHHDGMACSITTICHAGNCLPRIRIQRMQRAIVHEDVGFLG